MFSNFIDLVDRVGPPCFADVKFAGCDLKATPVKVHENVKTGGSGGCRWRISVANHVFQSFNWLEQNEAHGHEARLMTLMNN